MNVIPETAVRFLKLLLKFYRLSWSRVIVLLSSILEIQNANGKQTLMADCLHSQAAVVMTRIIIGVIGGQTARKEEGDDGVGNKHE